MTALTQLLEKIQDVSVTQRDKGTSFENLMVQYFLNEPKYAELYTEVLSYSDWVEKYGEKLNITDKRDYGIDLVAVTIEGDFHPIQCKNYNTTPISTLNKLFKLNRRITTFFIHNDADRM